MRWHFRLTPALGILILVVAAFSDAQETKDKQDQKEPAPPMYFPLKVGNQWTFKVTVGENSANAVSRIAKIENIDGEEMARLEAAVNGNIVATEHLRQTEKGIFRHRNNGAEITPPIQLLKFPVKDKDKWGGDIKVGNDLGKYTCESKKENVEVPAGKFETIRVSIRLEGKGQNVNTSYWFVKDVGFVKQTVDAPGGLSILMEMEKFEKAK